MGPIMPGTTDIISHFFASPPLPSTDQGINTLHLVHCRYKFQVPPGDVAVIMLGKSQTILIAFCTKLREMRFKSYKYNSLCRKQDIARAGGAGQVRAVWDPCILYPYACKPCICGVGKADAAAGRTGRRRDTERSFFSASATEPNARSPPLPSSPLL